MLREWENLPWLKYLEIASRVEKQVARFEVPMQHVGAVNVFQAPQDLVEEVADVVIAQPLCFQQFVQVRFHQALHDVNVFHLVDGTCA